MLVLVELPAGGLRVAARHDDREKRVLAPADPPKLMPAAANHLRPPSVPLVSSPPLTGGGGRRFRCVKAKDWYIWIIDVNVSDHPEARTYSQP